MGKQPFEVLFYGEVFFSVCKGNMLIVFEKPSANIMWFVVFLGIMIRICKGNI